MHYGRNGRFEPIMDENAEAWRFQTRLLGPVGINETD